MSNIDKAGIVLESVFLASSVAAAVAGILSPGSVSGWAWATMAALASVRCLTEFRMRRTAERSAERWFEECRKRCDDISMLCRENSALAARLRDAASCDTDELK